MISIPPSQVRYLLVNNFLHLTAVLMDTRTELKVLMERFRGTDLDGLETLISIAIDLSYAGDHQAEKFWEKLHPSLWEQTQSPWVILKTVSVERLKAFLADPNIRADLKKFQEKNQSHHRSWFEGKYHHPPIKNVVYICM